MSDPGRSAEATPASSGGEHRATTDGRRATTACDLPLREPGVARRGTTKDATRAAAAAAGTTNPAAYLFFMWQTQINDFFPG